MLRLILRTSREEAIRSQGRPASGASNIRWAGGKITGKRNALEAQQREAPGIADVSSLVSRKAELLASLTRSESAVDLLRAATAPFDEEMSAREAACGHLESQIRVLEWQKERLTTSSAEADAEVGLLSMNEVAAEGLPAAVS